MEPISTLFGKKRFPPAAKTRRTERGDLMDAILARLNPPRVKDGYPPIDHKRLGFLLTQTPTKDLYALVSGCLDAERRGGSYSKYFWYAIRPPKDRN